MKVSWPSATTMAGALLAGAVLAPIAAPAFLPSVNHLAGLRSGGTLNAISCTSTTSCVAVGVVNSYTAPFELAQPIVLRGNPATWNEADAKQLTVGKTFDYEAGLQAIDCTTAVECVAVGWSATGLIVLRGNPASWTGASPKRIALGKSFGSYGMLNGLTCAAATSCVAVGYDDGGPHGSSEPLVLHGNPKGWSTASARQLKLGSSYGGSGFLEGVTCTSATSCVTVGGAGDGNPITQRGSPTSWGSRFRQIRSGEDGTLSAVACSSATSCVAVGASTLGCSPDDTACSNSPTLLKGNPTTWSATDSRRLGVAGGLDAISCTRSACAAVGDRGDDDGPDEPLVLQGSPATWTTGSLQEVTLGSSLGGVGSLAGVACTATTQCAAVGTDGGGTGALEPFVPITPLTLVGSALPWSASGARAITLTGPRFHVTSDVHSMACPLPSVCVVVGTSEQSNGAGFAVAGNPAAWSNAVTRQPCSGSPDSGELSCTLAGVSCPSATYCVAVGQGDGGSLVLQGNPMTWTAADVTSFAGPGLLAISCTSTTNCVAVGGGDVLHGDPATWSSSDVGSIEPGLSLNAISCVDSTTCVAVGSESADEGQPVVVAGDPTTWDAADVQQLLLGEQGLGNYYTALDGVSCTSASWCAAVGEGPSGEPIEVQGDPGAWSGSDVRYVPVHSATSSAVTGLSVYEASNLYGNSLVAISCQSDTSCVATGNDDNGAPIYEIGTPSSWATTPALRPTATSAVSATLLGFPAVSCASAACFVSGTADTGILLSPLTP